MSRVSPEGRRAGIAAFLASSAVAALGISSFAGQAPDRAPRVIPKGAVEIQLLGVNDFHGHLESPQPGFGGAATLDAHLDKAERSHPGRTLRVHAGDMAGASPLLSSWFHDEPAVRAMNLMDFDVGTLGNHEFDDGGPELLRLLRGGHRDDGRQFKRDAGGRLVDTSAPDFEGVGFPYVAANTVDRAGNLILPPFKIVERAGVKVGFIGVTTLSTPHWLLQERAEHFDWLDISNSVNRWVPELRERGAETIVVLAHSGGVHAGGDARAATGEIIDEAREMSDAVDVVIAGHTQRRVEARVPNRGGIGDKLVIEARAYGVAFDRVLLTVDRASGDVIAKRSAIPWARTAEVRPDPQSARLVAGYRRRLGPLADEVVAQSARALEAQELVEIVAEGQRRLADTDVAIASAISIRRTLDPGPISYADAFMVQAYDHDVLRLEVPGRALGSLPPTEGIAIAGGESIDPSRTYSVAVSALLLDQEALAAVKAAATGRRRAGSETDAFAAELRRRGAI